MNLSKAGYYFLKTLWRKRFRIILIPLSVICIAAGNKPEDEYLVKSAFIERFSRFIEWPENQDLKEPGSRFIIAVYGKNPFGKALDSLAVLRKIKDRQVEIRYLTEYSSATKCHILFIPGSESRNVSKIISAAENKPVLTICESDETFEKGAHIELFFIGRKLSFRINESALHKSGLKASYMLLMAAHKSDDR